MTIEHLHASASGVDLSPGIGEAGSLKADYRVATISASAEVGSTYTFARVPSNIRLADQSRFFTRGSTAGNLNYNCGIFGVDGNIIDDDNALFSHAADINTPIAVLRTTNAIIDQGKQIWELVNGQTEDPGGFFDIKVTLTSGSTTTMATQLILTMCIAYTID